MKKLAFHHSEQGSAILITLGILTLVLVLALVFVATSQNARTIAMANADSGNASLVAESAAARAEAVAYYLQSEITANKPANSTVSDLQYDYQPYVGNFLTDSDLGNLVKNPYLQAAPGSLSSDPDARQLQSILYTHDDDNQGSLDSSPYSLIAGTKLGKFLEASTSNFKSVLTDNPDTRLTYRNILDSDNHVNGRYAFLMLSEGSKFNLNRIVLATEGSNDNHVPIVDDGQLDVSNHPGHDLETPGSSTFAIAGYHYTDGEIDEVKDDGKYKEKKTLQYGLHPQEWRISEEVDDLADLLKIGENDHPPKWFNYDSLLAAVWDENDADDPLLDFWHLYCLNGGADDREVLFHGTEAEIGDCSTDSPKINLAFPSRKKWDAISDELEDELTADPQKSVEDYLGTKFEDILGAALHEDTAGDKLFQGKDKDDNVIDTTPQVFANLVDFCDSDDFITYQATANNAGVERLDFNTPIDVTTGDILVDDACGNERTPAVIGVGLELTYVNWIAGQTGSSWSFTGDGTTTAHVRVVLQNYFNEEIDLPEKVRVVIRGRINPWFAGRHTVNAGGTSFWVYDYYTRSTTPINLPNGYPDVQDGGSMDFSNNAANFVIDQEILLSGQLAEREVNDTAIDFEANFPAGCMSGTVISSNIQRAGLWLQITDILVMTANMDGGSPRLTDLAYANGDSHIIHWKKDADRFYLPWGNVYDPGYRPIAWLVAQDPRCNHNHTNWQWFDELEERAKNSETGFPLSVYKWPSGDATTTHGIAKPTAFDMQNKLRTAALSNIQRVCKNGDLTVAKDYEPDLNFVNLSGGQSTNTFSTAFIPNHPITSLWQLGAVFRGFPGQTINLKKYGGPKGGLQYGDGDAWLLDYFKLNELAADSPFPGKFNPNCFNADSYRYLLANIPANPDPNDTAVYQPGRISFSDVRRNSFYDQYIKTESDTILLEGEFFEFNEQLNYETSDYDEDEQAQKQSWSPVEAFYNFVKFKATPKYKVKTGTDAGGTPTYGSQQNANDRMLESLIGCSAGLLSTRYEYFTVFAVGQNVKYIGQTHNSTREDYLPVEPVEPEAGYTPGADAGKDFYNQLINPVKIRTSATEEGWYSILSTQMRIFTIERDCWFNTMRVVRTQLY